MSPSFDDYLTASFDDGKDDHEALEGALYHFPSKRPPRLCGAGWLKLYRHVHSLRQKWPPQEAV